MSSGNGDESKKIINLGKKIIREYSGQKAKNRLFFNELMYKLDNEFYNEKSNVENKSDDQDNFMEKNKLALIIFITLIGCSRTSVHNKISESIDFEWGISQFYYYDKSRNLELDLLRDERIYGLGFEDYKYLWFVKVKEIDKQKNINT